MKTQEEVQREREGKTQNEILNDILDAQKGVLGWIRFWSILAIIGFILWLLLYWSNT